MSLRSWYRRCWVYWSWLLINTRLCIFWWYSLWRGRYWKFIISILSRCWVWPTYSSWFWSRRGRRIPRNLLRGWSSSWEPSRPHRYLPLCSISSAYIWGRRSRSIGLSPGCRKWSGLCLWKVSRKRRARSRRSPNNWDSGTISSTTPFWEVCSQDQWLNCCTK